MSDESDGRSEWWSHPITNSGGMIGPGGQEISNGGAVGPNAGPAIPSQGFPDGRPAKSVDGPQPGQGKSFPNDVERTAAGAVVTYKPFQATWAGLREAVEGSSVASSGLPARRNRVRLSVRWRGVIGGL